MPIGTAFHERTFPLCQSLNYRDWAGYYAPSVYEAHHEHEYNAIRNSSALIDVSPLFKYLVRGRDAARFINRVITRDINKVAVGQVIYTCWCDEQGHVIDDGTISRLDENTYRWTAAEPNLRWFVRNAQGLDVTVEDISERLASLALQGPTSARLLEKISEADIRNLRYFRVTHGRIAGVPVDVSRTGYTGDLGYEIWIPAQSALPVWDAIVNAGPAFDLHPAGILALDVARIEAGLILLDVDYISSRKALIDAQRYSPYEIGLGRLVQLEKESFIGRDALEQQQRRGVGRKLVGLEIDWDTVERRYDEIGLAPQVPSTASRVAVPVFRESLPALSATSRQVGRATSTTWSPVLKKFIALASVATQQGEPGNLLQIEMTIEAVHHKIPARVVDLPFFNPKRKTATPV